MRDFTLWEGALAASVFCSIFSVAMPAGAQTPAAPSAAPATVAPGAAPPPPPGYGYPPPPGYGYPPPPGYGTYPPPRLMLRAPESAPYEGGPVPAGYHVEERYRRGLIIGGSITMGVPWMLSVLAASAADFKNQSGWLVVPALGPWITMLARDKDRICSTDYQTGAQSYCYDEVNSGVRTVLILDGLVQGAGAIMLIYGLAAPKKVIVRDFMGRLHFTPAQMGRLGYGGVLSGEF